MPEVQTQEKLEDKEAENNANGADGSNVDQNISQENTQTRPEDQKNELEEKRSFFENIKKGFAERFGIGKKKLEIIKEEQEIKSSEEELKATEEVYKFMESITDNKHKKSMDKLKEHELKRKFGIVYGLLKNYLNENYDSKLVQFYMKHKAKVKGVAGAAAIGVGVLAGAQIFTMLGGAYLLRGGVEGINNYLREHKKQETGLTFKQMMEQANTATTNYAELLSEEIYLKTEVNSSDYYEKIANLLEFKKKADSGEVEIEFFKVGKEVKSRVVGSGKEGEIVGKPISLKTLIKQDKRRDLVANLAESAAGIAGAVAGGSYSLITGAWKEGAIGVRPSWEGWLTNLTKDNQLVSTVSNNLPPDSAARLSDFHQLTQLDNGTIGFVRDRAQQAFVEANPGWAESIKLGHIVPKGALTSSEAVLYKTAKNVYNMINQFNINTISLASIFGAERGADLIGRAAGESKETKELDKKEAQYEEMVKYLRAAQEKAKEQESGQKSEEEKSKEHAEDDYSQTAVGDIVVLEFEGNPYRFVVMGKSLDKNGLERIWFKDIDNANVVKVGNQVKTEFPYTRKEFNEYSFGKWERKNYTPKEWDEFEVFKKKGLLENIKSGDAIIFKSDKAKQELVGKYSGLLNKDEEYEIFVTDIGKDTDANKIEIYPAGGSSESKSRITVRLIDLLHVIKKFGKELVEEKKEEPKGKPSAKKEEAKTETKLEEKKESYQVGDMVEFKRKNREGKEFTQQGEITGIKNDKYIIFSVGKSVDGKEKVYVNAYSKEDISKKVENK